MAELLTFHTDVLVDYLRGVPEAVACLEDRSEILMLSAVSVAKLFAGVREGIEHTAPQRQVWIGRPRGTGGRRGMERGGPGAPAGPRADVRRCGPR